jgi:glycosyltransferase involved in cell wall biosynthesis
MLTSRKISIIIPAYNEEKNIEQTVTELADAFRNAQIIVVCNGCKDRTYEVARRIKRPNVKVINFYRSIGKGGAILEGFKLANGDVVGFVDADGSFRIDDIEKIISALEKYDCVIASKWKDKNFFEVQSGLTRKIGSRGWNFLAKLVSDVDFRDTQAGLKFFKRDVVDSMLKEEFVCRGFDFDVELLHRVKEAGFKINETYVPIKDGGKSSFEMRTSPKMFLNLLKFYFSKDSGSEK